MRRGDGRGRDRGKRRRTPSGVTAGLLGTVTVHAAAVGLALFGVPQGRREPSPPVYAVELVAAPAPTPNKRLAPEALPTPPEEPPAPVKSTPPKPAEKVAPVPKPKPAPKPVERREAPPKTVSKATPLPGETPGTGTDVANVKTPGLAFPYPEYLRNIMNEIYKRWGSQHPPLSAEIQFFIHRDGSVSGLRFVKRSGNFSFDLEAQGAIEAASNGGAFGPLPDGWESDVLPISFFFEPRR